MFGLYILVVTIIDFGQVEWQFFSRMSGRPIASHWSTATQRLNVMMPTSGSGISKERSKALPGNAVASSLEILHPVFDGVAGDAEVLLLQLLHAGQHRVAPERVLDVEHHVEPVANDDLRGPRLDALQQVLVTPEEPRDELLLGELDACRARAEQSGVDRPASPPGRLRRTCWFGIVVRGVGGQELVLHALELGDDLVVPGGPLDLGHRLGAVALAPPRSPSRRRRAACTARSTAGTWWRAPPPRSR